MMTSEFKKKINLIEWEFEFQQRDEHPVLVADLWCRALYNEFADEIDLSVKPLDYLMTSQSKGYIKKDQKKLVIDLLQKTVDDDKYLQYIVDKTIERVEQLEVFADKVSKRKTSQGDLATFWQEFDKVFLKVIPWYYIPYYVTEHNMLSDRVKKGLRKHRDKIEKITDFNNALMTLIFPIEQVMFQKEQKDFYELVAYVEKKRNFDKDGGFKQKANKYLDKYAWMKTFFLLPIEPLAMSELVERIRGEVNSRGLEEYHSQEKRRGENEQLADALLGVLKDDKELVRVIGWARKYGWLLTSSVERALRALAVLQPFYKEIARELGIEWADLMLLKSGEIVEGLEKSELLVSKEEMNKRSLGFVLAIEGGCYSLVVGKEGAKLAGWIDDGASEVVDSVDEIKGVSASSGVVKGVVRVVLRAGDSHSIKEGEVLVCAMTSPDYLPAMKKAVAIVTDEGGLLCHAAIVSREINKPCVIATKIATKALKDGDEVEVNASSGIIKKI